MWWLLLVGLLLGTVVGADAADRELWGHGITLQALAREGLTLGGAAPQGLCHPQDRPEGSARLGEPAVTARSVVPADWHGLVVLTPAVCPPHPCPAVGEILTTPAGLRVEPPPVVTLDGYWHGGVDHETVMVPSLRTMEEAWNPLP